MHTLWPELIEFVHPTKAQRKPFARQKMIILKKDNQLLHKPDLLIRIKLEHVFVFSLIIGGYCSLRNPRPFRMNKFQKDLGL